MGERLTPNSFIQLCTPHEIPVDEGEGFMTFSRRQVSGLGQVELEVTSESRLLTHIQPGILLLPNATSTVGNHRVFEQGGFDLMYINLFASRVLAGQPTCLVVLPKPDDPDKTITLAGKFYIVDPNIEDYEDNMVEKTFWAIKEWTDIITGKKYHIFGSKDAKVLSTPLFSFGLAT